MENISDRSDTTNSGSLDKASSDRSDTTNSGRLEKTFPSHPKRNLSGRFGKEEKLTSITRIQEIFDKGSVLFSHPLKIYYLPNDCPHNRVLITVPKRLHKKAVDRNLLKRRLREAYRLNKAYLFPESERNNTHNPYNLHNPNNLFDNNQLHDLGHLSDQCYLHDPEQKAGTSVFVDINIVYISGEILEFKLLNKKISDVLAKIKRSISVVDKPADEGNITVVPAAD